jgi:hypothetical protein
MKKIDLMNLNNAIVDIINKNEKSPKIFSYALFRNESILTPIIDTFNKLKKPLCADMTELEKERIKLVEQYSEKDEINEQGNKFVKKNITTFIEEYNKLITENSKYKTAIEETKKNEQEFKDFLETEFTEEINLTKISINDFPDTIEPQIIYLLKEIIKD